MVFLFVGLVSAIGQSYESATTSRIVGDSATDMKTQLQDDSLMDFERAVHGGLNADDIAHILQQAVKDYYSLIGLGATLRTGLDVNKDVLLIINPVTKTESMTDAGYMDTDDAEELQELFERNDNLVVLNSPYNGLYIPEEDSLVAELSPRTSVVAPMSYSSDAFLKAFVCNLGEYDTVGETYRQARNNYYWNTNDKNELIGLTLMSYMLYGSPFKEIEIPESVANTYCRDYHENFDILSNTFSIAEVSASNNLSIYRKNMEFKIDNLEIANDGNYSVIQTDSMNNFVLPYELVLPSRTLVEEFPEKTIITGFGVSSLSDSESLQIENLPMFDGFGYVDKVCYQENKSAGVLFENSYSEGSKLVITTINPVEVTDCENGELKIYKDIEYYIEYVPYSPILVKSVSAPISVPGQKINLTIELENMQQNSVQGYLTLQDEDGYILTGINITADTGTYNMELTAPESEGMYNYRVDFDYNNESVAYKEFMLNVNAIKLGLIVVGNSTSEANLIVVMDSNLNSTIDANIDYSLEHLGEIEENDEEELSIEPGLNLFDLSFTGLDRTKISYDVVVGLSYLENYQVDTVGIIVEHSPTIVQPNIVIRENETLDISPEVYDIDGDEVTIIIDSPFENNSLIDFDSSGAYEVGITADDGIKQITKTIALTIENTNRPPVLDAMDKLTGKEGELITFNPSYSDPDNENSVENDDNDLTISSDGFINSTGEFELDYESSGIYTILVSVSDGEYYDTKELEVEIENTNRAPEITVDSINVDENSVLNISEYVFDMDNNNSVSNDDNDLIVTCSDLFDSEGIWEIDYESAGVYDINVSVSDGEFEVSRIITINVANINRAPVIERIGREKYYIPENSDLLLEVNAFDLDKDDTFNISWYIGDEKVNEGNEFTFNANETIAEYNIDVVAADNYLTNETNFDVVVSDVPIFDGLDGETSDLNASELNSVYPFILEKAGKVKIIFQEPVNLEDTVDFVNTLILDDSYASLDSEFLEALRGIPAHVIFYNLDVEGNPIVYYNEEFGLDADTICPSSICSNIRYVSSNNTLEFDISHFSTYAIEGRELSQFDLDADNITIEDPLKREIFTTFLIKNSGLGDLDNLAISGIFNPGFDLEVSPNMISLPSQETAAITVFGAIMDIFSKDIVEAGTISFKDNDFERDIKLYIKPITPVQISNLDIKVGDKSYNNLEDGDDINILPSKEMTILIEVENLYQIEMDSDVEVELYIDEFDFDKTLNFDLNNDDKREKEVSLTIPAELSKDEYELEITLEADLENDMKSEAELVIELNYDNDSVVVSRPEQVFSRELQPTKTISIHGKPVFNMELSDISPEFILVIFLLLNITLIAIILTWIARRN